MVPGFCDDGSYYTVTYDGNVVASGDGDFGYSKSTTFGTCDPQATPAPQSPTTSTPTKSPSLSPSLSCSLTPNGQSCTNDDDCCSNLCSSGKPSKRTCLPNVDVSTPSPTFLQSTDSPTTSPTVGENNTPEPTRGGTVCKGNKEACVAFTDCCSLKCNGGFCKGS